MESKKYLVHHGVKGQKWGVKNGPPYPIERSKNGTAKAINNIISTWDRKDRVQFWRDDANYQLNDEIVDEYAYSKVLFNKNVPVSFLGFNYYEDAPEDLNIFIGTKSGEEYRRRGYSQKLITEAKEWMNSQEGDIYWSADVNNIPSNSLAVKNGFEYVRTFMDEQGPMNEYKYNKNSK